MNYGAWRSWSIVVMVLLAGCQERHPVAAKPVPAAAASEAQVVAGHPAPATPAKRAANPPNGSIRTPMSPAYKLRDKEWNLIQVPSEIHAVAIRAAEDDGGGVLVITLKNEGEAFEVERAGFIFTASLLPQDPPLLWKAFEREMQLPRTMQPGEEIVVRITKADVQAKPAEHFHAKDRRGKDIVCAGISLIDREDGMHWYSVGGVSTFVTDCTEATETAPKKPPSRF